MWNESWKDVILEPDGPPRLWESFHENSKIGRYDTGLAEADVRAWMGMLLESLEFTSRRQVRLPRKLSRLDMPLEEAIRRRSSSRRLTDGEVSLRDLATMLHYGYGITRSRKEESVPRALRSVPSAGALFPLEIFIQATNVGELPMGTYHYSPARHSLSLLKAGGHKRELAEAVLQPPVAKGCSLFMFITAVFERSTFKYGDRGYRFVLLEAGHVAQNIALCAASLGLGCLPIGGFLDRKIDGFLDLDGITHSTLYLVALGREGAAGTRTAEHARQL
jgi:SagB-type dehydrogenase family enzyme